MSRREPRRPKWVEGPAKVSSVKSVAYDPTNEAVTSFLQGALVQEPSNPFAEENEQKIALNMKLLSKKSATTKMKALENISSAVQSVSDEVAGLYIYNFVDLISQHLHHESSQVRCGFYKTLESFISVMYESDVSETDASSSSTRGRTTGNSVKRQIAQNLGSLMRCWLSSLHDPDTQVALAAERSFLACFPAIEKRQVALERSFDSVSKHILSLLEEGFRKPTSKQLRSEEIDMRASFIIMAFGAVSYLLKYHPNPNEVQPLAMGLLSSRSGDYLRQCLTVASEATQVTNVSPRARPSAIKLLSEIVAVKCPITKRDFVIVWNTICSGINDFHPAVSCAAWRLALLWFENFKEESLESLPDSFIGLVLTKIDALSSASQGVAVEAFLSALLPVATVVSRIPQHCDIVDDVCGALTEAVKHFSTRPTSHEYALIWKTLFECWELHLLRKFANGYESHSTELLAVILAVLIEQVTTTSNVSASGKLIPASLPLDHRRRLVHGIQRSVAPVAVKHIGRGLARILKGPCVDSEGKQRGNADYVKDVLFTLIDKGEKFKFLAQSGEHRPILIIFVLNMALLWVKDQTFEIVTTFTVEWLETLILNAFEECKKELADGVNDNGGLVLDAFSAFIVQLIEEGDKERDTQSPLSKAYQLSDELITQMTTQLILWDQFSLRLAPAFFKKKVSSDQDNESSVSPSQIILASFLAKPVEEAVVPEVNLLLTAVKADILPGNSLLSILDKVVTGTAILGGRFSELTPEVFKSLSRQKYKIPLLKCNDILSAIVESIEYIRCDANVTSSDVTQKTPKSLVYDNEAPSCSDDSNSSDSDRNDDSSRSDNDDMSEVLVKPPSSNVHHVVIHAGEITAALFEWMDIIGDPTFHVDFIASTDSNEKEMRLIPILREILYGIATMSPVLCWESFCSLPLLRNSIISAEDTVKGSVNLLRVSQGKFHRVASLENFYSLIDSFEVLCRTDVVVTKAVTDELVSEFMHIFILYPIRGILDNPLCATSYIMRLFRHLCDSMSHIILMSDGDGIHPFHGLLSEIYNMSMGLRSQNSKEGQNSILKKGRIPLIEMNHSVDSVSAAIRFGQLIQVLITDDTNLKQVTDTKSLVMKTENEQKEYQRLTSLLIGSLVRTVAFSGALNDNIVMSSMKVLRTLVHDLPKDLSSETERKYCQEIWELVAIDLTTVGLLESLGSVFSNMQSSKYCTPLTFMCQWFVITHCVPCDAVMNDNVRASHAAFQLFLSARCAVMDITESCTFLSKECETTIRTCLINPKLSPFETVTLLAILRTDKRLFVTDDEMAVVFNKVTKGGDNETGLSILAELCCANNGNINVYADICRAAAHWASLNYSLKHFPSNGKLGQRIPSSVPIPVTLMRPSVLSLIKVSRGLSMYGRRDDVLRSTINLAVFDATCECIHRLGSSASGSSTTSNQRQDIANAVDFIAEIYPYLSSLESSDITSIAASEKSVAVISSSLYYVHLWLCGSTLVGLETQGISNILEVISCINTIAIVALGGRSDSDMMFVNCHENVQSVRKRCLVKNLRHPPFLKGGGSKEKHKGTSLEMNQKVKINFFRKNFRAISRTTKQKLSLFTYLTSWVCIVSNSMNRSSSRVIGEGSRGIYHPKAAALGLEDQYFSSINKSDEDAMHRASLMASHEVKNEIFKLMDLIVTLFMCLTHALLNGALSKHTDDNGDNGKDVWKSKNSNRIEEIYLLLTQEKVQYAVGQGYVPSVAFDPQCLGRLQMAAHMSASKQSNMLMDCLARGAISLYALLLQSRFLSYVKDWLATVDVSVSQKLVSFTETHISPVLVQDALAEVLSHNDGSGESMSANTFEVDEDYSVTVSTRFKSLILTYVKDEAKVSCKIILPSAYPLHAAQIPDQVVEGQNIGKRNGSSTPGIGDSLKWQTWMMRMTAALFSTGEMPSGSLWNAVKVFGDNVKRHYEGTEPCPICYSIVNSNNKLPDMDCRVCKNRCHSSCLYQWWSNSGQTSCPLCRSAWVS